MDDIQTSRPETEDVWKTNTEFGPTTNRPRGAK